MFNNSLDPNKQVPALDHPQTSQTVDENPNKPEPHVITAQGAVQVVRAEGEFGDKVAFAAFSDSNFGVSASSVHGVGLFASGELLAAQLEGGVTVSGACDIAGDIHTNGRLTAGGDIHTDGSLIAAGDIQLTGADYAEDFDTIDPNGALPGTVMVLDDCGGVRISDIAYDRRVAGVISGAGGYKPAVILDRQATTATARRPLALMGKVYCLADASDAPIAIGDLLTTSSTPGHAMKAVDPSLAFGSVIGKALQPLAAGRGLVPILVALQ